MIYSENELMTLARAYCAATKTTFHTLGIRVVNNHKFFRNLEAGKGAHSRSVGLATEWFQKNWPDDLPWPDPETPTIPRSQSADAPDNYPVVDEGQHTF